MAKSTAKKFESRQRVPIIQLSIDLDRGETDTLTLYDSDIPLDVAREFVSRHKLPSTYEESLLKQIESSIEDLVSEQNEHSFLELRSPSNSSQISNARQSQISNVGDRLYLQGLASKKRLERKIENYTSREEKEDMSHPFKPTINSTSDRLAKQYNRCNFHRVERRAHEHALKERENCTFSPQINSRSKKIQHTKHYEKLYKEAQTKRERQEEKCRQSQCSFRPEINSYYSRERSEEVINRLYKPRAPLNFKPSPEPMKDPDTGQEFFKPIINSEFKSRRKSESKVHIKKCLISGKKSQELKGKHKSDQLMRKVKLKAYMDIFEILAINDAVMGGLLNTEKLDEKLLKVLNPLIEEIEDIKEPLSLQDFIEAMENLMRTLTPLEKKVVLFGKRTTEIQEDRRIQKVVPADRVFLRNVEKQKQSLSKIERQREISQNSQLEGCTFQPKTTPYRKTSRN